MQHFTRFQLTVCSRGSSALAELLVQDDSHSVANLLLHDFEFGDVTHVGRSKAAFTLRVVLRGTAQYCAALRTFVYIYIMQIKRCTLRCRQEFCTEITVD